MSILETTPADLESAVQAARTVAALIPRVQMVGLLRTVPGSTHARLVEMKNTDDCRLNWAGCVKVAQSERGIEHLEHMTVYADWMEFDLSQDAIDATDGDKN